MKVEIVSISTKLLMGDILDTNTAYVSRSLQKINAHLTCKVVVGDDLEMIADAMRVALRRSDIVLTIGGVNSGANNFTRMAAAQVTKRKLIAQEPGIEGACLLGGGDTKASGFIIETEDGLLICLPGKRRELGYLLETDALAYLRKYISGPARQNWVVLRTVGIMESSLKQELAGIVQDAHHRVTYDSFAGQTNIQLWVQADTQEQIDHELAQMKQVVLDRLGDHVYGEADDRLEAVVLQALVDGEHRLALAECYTNQTLANVFADLKVSKDVLRAVPSNTMAELAEAVDLDMLEPDNDLSRWCRIAAERLLNHKDADLGLVIYKNLSQGGVQLLVTLASPLGVSVTQRSFGGHPENIDQWATTLGLSHLRRWLLVHH
jgi:nicotinamide-nucleotide amidase